MAPKQDISRQLKAALSENERLHEEIRQLKAALAPQSVTQPELKPFDPRPITYWPSPFEIAQVTAPVEKASKVALFHSLFRGREDVYAERWRMKDGTWGYRPAGQKNWEAVLSSRPEDYKRVDRETRRLFPFSENAIVLHLTGKKAIGIYPLLIDETCWLLAADFDKEAWQENSLAFVATCHKMGVPAYLERSRSGNGGHVWFFFERPIPAVLARKMGCAILTQTMEKRHQLSLKSYDRFFPNQDTMPKGGFGNLIALPLQWMPRQLGNSLFIDDNLNAYPNQWQLLASVRRVAIDHVDWVVNDAAGAAK